MFSTGRLVALGAAATMAASSLLQACPAKADDEGAVLGDVAVSQVAATPARAGETTIVTFSVENSGSERITITGLRMPDGEPARIMGAFGQGQSGEIGALPIRAGTVERLERGKIWIEVGPLARDLEPRSTVPAHLVLGTHESPLTLHIGPVASGSMRYTHVNARMAFRPFPAANDGAGC